jgi:hypothetical protein
MTSKNLLPCPLCGGRAQLKQLKARVSKSQDWATRNENTYQRAEVHCVICGANVLAEVSNKCNGANEAAKAAMLKCSLMWNNRKETP